MTDDSASTRAAALAASQHGVLAHHQLRDVGITRSTASRWVAEGRLVRLHRGVYSFGHASLTRDGWWNAAVLVAGPGSWLTARAGCTVWSVLPNDHGPIDVVSPRHVAHPPPWMRAHRTAITSIDTTMRRGLPVASLEWAIIDLAETASAHDVASALDQALLLGLLDRRRVEDAVAMAHGRHGLKVLRPVLLRLSAHGELFLSRTERRLRDAVIAAGLPHPLMNERVHGPGGRRCRPDLRWPDHRLIAEVDGPQHAMPYQQMLDRQRDTWLRAEGYRVMRFPVEQLDADPGAVVEQLREALLSRCPSRVSHFAPEGWEQSD